MIRILFLSSLFLFVQIHAMDPISETPQKQAASEEVRKVKCSDGTTDMPMSILDMSQMINNMKEDLGGTIPNDFPLPLVAYQCATIENLCALIKGMVIAVEKFDSGIIDGYSLEQLIEMTNAFNYLDFSQSKSPEAKPLVAKWKKYIDDRIYLECRDKSWKDLQIFVSPTRLHGDLIRILFCDPIITKFKFELLKVALEDDTRRVDLPTGGMAGSAFSRDGKMIALVLASYRGGKALITIVFPEGNRYTKYEPYDSGVTEVWPDTGQFSSDGKKFIIGAGKNILLYDITDQGVLVVDEHSVQKLSDNIICSSDVSWLSKQIVLNSDSTLMVSYDQSNLLLWYLDTNGSNEDRSKILLQDVKITGPIKFSDDGTILVMVKGEQSSSDLYQFDREGKLIAQLLIEGVSDQTVFYSHSKKFVTFKGSDKNLYEYNFEDKNKIVSNKIVSLDVERVFFDPTKIILNDTATIVLSRNGLQMIDIDENNREIIQRWGTSAACYFCMSPDNTKIIFSAFRGPYTLYTLLTPEEKNVLSSLELIDVKSMWLIGRILKGLEDCPSIGSHEIPNDIMNLLNKICEYRAKRLQELKESKKRERDRNARLAAAEGRSSVFDGSNSKSDFDDQDKKPGNPVPGGNNPGGKKNEQTLFQGQKIPQVPVQQHQQEDTPPPPGIFEQLLSGILFIPKHIFLIIKFVISGLINLFN
jgi:hypothetical protein